MRSACGPGVCMSENMHQDEGIGFVCDVMPYGNAMEIPFNMKMHTRPSRGPLTQCQHFHYKEFSLQNSPARVSYFQLSCDRTLSALCHRSFVFLHVANLTIFLPCSGCCPANLNQPPTISSVLSNAHYSHYI